MAAIIVIGALNTNSPQQNAGAFIGEYNFAGWDANMKLGQGHGGTFGFFNWYPLQFNLNFDNFEGIDGAMNDADLKPMAGTNL